MPSHKLREIFLKRVAVLGWLRPCYFVVGIFYFSLLHVMTIEKYDYFATHVMLSPHKDFLIGMANRVYRTP